MGYDLAGISSDKIAGFISRMGDARGVIDRMRRLILPPFEALRELDFPSRIADTVTLSTFHGCRPDEIEKITKHLMTRHQLAVIVKLNPTLLGFAGVSDLLQRTLGYEHLRLDPHSFVEDLSLDRAVELIVELREFARVEGRRFGVRLTNTLAVDLPQRASRRSDVPVRPLAARPRHGPIGLPPRRAAQSLPGERS